TQQRSDVASRRHLRTLNQGGVFDAQGVSETADRFEVGDLTDTLPGVHGLAVAADAVAQLTLAHAAFFADPAQRFGGKEKARHGGYTSLENRVRRTDRYRAGLFTRRMAVAPGPIPR